jgi:hypothetical protein
MRRVGTCRGGSRAAHRVGRFSNRPYGVWCLLLLFAGTAPRAYGQDPHAGMHHDAPKSGWTFMQDAAVFLVYNDQGSPRGTREVKSPNWWMGMAQRPLANGVLTVNLMLSLEPATIGGQGYRHIFQVGETYLGNALIDHQHPHDFLMQASAVWRRPFENGFALTLAGAPVGEPALGPIAFMHRSSAAENPMSPLGHHTFDSTHIAMGVLTAAVERGPFQVEASLFHGAEPDEDRWDLMDAGALDSSSVRAWYRPTATWSFQLSHGFLRQPEALVAGDLRRTTASAAWKKTRDAGSTSVTVAWGRNHTLGGAYDAAIAEMTRARPSHALYWRVEATQVETDVLRTGVHLAGGGRKDAHFFGDGARDFVGAVTAGATRTLLRTRGWDIAGGGHITAYAVPASLSPFYGTQPWSALLFLRVRPPARHRMFDMIMTRPMM